MAHTVITLVVMSTLRSGPSSEVPDTSRHRALAAASRVRMLMLVRQSEGGMTAAQVADATGLHPSTVRAHLEQLAESGLLTRHRQSDGSPGRPAWRYEAVSRPDGDAETRTDAIADRPYRDLAAALIGHLARAEDDPHAAGVRAGRDWGRALAAPLARTAPVDGLVRVLDRLGFTPQVVDREDSDSAVVHLRTCPFLDLAEASPDVVCGVHLGVIGGALGALGASAATTDLEPFAVPGACVVRVHARNAAAGRHPSSAGEVPAGGRPDQ
jgi:predicted ArsR family transcriptional regulator